MNICVIFGRKIKFSLIECLKIWIKSFSEVVEIEGAVMGDGNRDFDEIDQPVQPNSPDTIKGMVKNELTFIYNRKLLSESFLDRKF